VQDALWAEAFAQPSYKWIGARQFVDNHQGWHISIFPGGIGFSLFNYADEKALRVRLNVIREDGVEEAYLSDAYYCGDWGGGWQKWQTHRLPLFPYEGLHGRIRHMTFSYSVLKDGLVIPSAHRYRFATLDDFYAGRLLHDDFNDPGLLALNDETIVPDNAARYQRAHRAINNNADSHPVAPYFTRGNTWAEHHPLHEVHRAIDRVIAAKAEDPDGGHSIRVAMFDFDHEHIATHLLYAQEQGIEVECIGDWAQVSSMNASENIARLRRGRIPVFGVVRNEPCRPRDNLASMHTKMILFDGREVHSASYNLHFHQWGGNWENAIAHYSAEACLLYDAIYQAVRYGHRVRLTTEPTDRLAVYYSFGEYRAAGHTYRTHDAIIGELQHAHESITVCMYDISPIAGNDFGAGTATDVVGALIAARDRGVRVQILLNGMLSHSGRQPADWDKAFRRPLKHPAQRLKDAWMEVFHVYYHESIYSPLHHKFAVIDNRTVITGSYNWYEPSLASDEIVTIVRDETVAAAYLEEVRLLLQTFRVERE
jgi:hypothetical protein